MTDRRKMKQYKIKAIVSHVTGTKERLAECCCITGQERNLQRNTNVTNGSC